MADSRYNMVVIGGGAAGLVSSYIAAAVRAKVVLIERHKMGGDCLNTGCVPSKALIKTARVIAEIRNHKHYGIKSASCEIDFAEVMARVKDVISKIEPHDSVERYTGLGVECQQGHAEIIDAHTVRVGDRTLKTKCIVLAMGAAPAIPKIRGLDQIKYWTSDNLWEMPSLPKRLVVLGGGPIGCEMAQAFQRLGSQVTQIEMGDRLLPRDDADVAQIIQERFKAEGIIVTTGAQATEVQVNGQDKILICEVKGQGRRTIPFDEILIAVGRRARTEGVDWARLGISLNANGTIKVDQYLRANGRNIYACGDVAGPYQLTHVAAHQAWYCAVNGLFSPFKKFKADYRVIPWVTFTDPEVAVVGLTEQAARAANVAYEVTTYGIDDLDRAIAETEDLGMVKVLTAPGKDKILGATIVSHNAGEMIAEFVTAMKHGIGLNKVLGTIHAYPTFVEANKYAAGAWKKARVPTTVLNYLARFHAVRR